jgi:hypothetical protein
VRRAVRLYAIVLVLTTVSVARSSAKEHAVDTYYDRNLDGVADYELHQASAVYLSYALIDSKFTGRYDEKIKLGYPYNTEPVNIPVPRHVKLVRGMPPNIIDERFKPRMWEP